MPLMMIAGTVRGASRFFVLNVLLIALLIASLTHQPAFSADNPGGTSNSRNWEHGEWYSENRYDMQLMTLAIQPYRVSYYFEAQSFDAQKNEEEGSSQEIAQAPALVVLAPNSDDLLSRESALEFSKTLPSWLVIRAPILVSNPAGSPSGSYRTEVYLKTGKLPPKKTAPGFAAALPLAEELRRIGITQATLLAPASSLQFLKELWPANDPYQSFIFLSPSWELLSADLPLAEKKILWVGSQREREKLERLAQKYGGDILTYEMAGSNYAILHNNHLVMGDLIEWLTAQP